MALELSSLIAILENVFDRLESRELLDRSPCLGVASQLGKLKILLMKIKSVLVDVETQQLKKELISCLDDLLDLVYDLDDMLDEFTTDILGRELMAERYFSISKVRKLIPAYFTDLTPNIHMASKIEYITHQFEALVYLGERMISRKRSTAVPLKPGEQMIPRATSTVVRTRPLPTYFPINSGIYGRDEDKAKILEMVLSDELSFSIISIVRMGAIGKTRLVQEVYNDKALEGFDMRAWVDVSYGTDIQQICKQLLQQITLSSRRIYGLQELLIALAKAVAGKKFLFVLDDVWIENYNREAFWRPFKAGAAGSKLIMTTRNVAVALTMQPSKCYNLNLLIKDACWATFEEYALGIRSINPQRTSPLIQEKVVEKIQGLLLAARTPSVMLSSKHRNQWENILNDKIFNYSYESKIIPVLETSYLYLYISQCPSVTFLSSRDQLFVGQKHLDIRDCSGLRTLLLQGQLPTTLEHLEISGCSELIRLSTNGLLPKILKHLDIADCAKLKSIAKSFDKGTSVGFIQIKNCKNLEFTPEGIHNLNSLHTTYAQDCPSLVSFPSKGFPNTNLTVLSIERCKKLTALPSRLQQLVIRQCPSIMSIPKEGFPANPTSLSIADVNLYNSLFQWGLHNLTNRRYLEIRGCLDAICFPIDEISMVLPTSLNSTDY